MSPEPIPDLVARLRALFEVRGDGWTDEFDELVAGILSDYIVRTSRTGVSDRVVALIPAIAAADPPPSQQEMAAALGTSRETVSRILARLIADGRIRERGRCHTRKRYEVLGSFDPTIIG